MHLKKQYLEYSVGCFLCASDSKVSGKSLMSQVTRAFGGRQLNLFTVHVIVYLFGRYCAPPLFIFENF